MVDRRALLQSTLALPLVALSNSSDPQIERRCGRCHPLADAKGHYFDPAKIGGCQYCKENNVACIGYCYHVQ